MKTVKGPGHVAPRTADVVIERLPRSSWARPLRCRWQASRARSRASAARTSASPRPGAASLRPRDRRADPGRRRPRDYRRDCAAHAQQARKV